jgi:hypothetical protein
VPAICAISSFDFIIVFKCPEPTVGSTTSGRCPTG